MKTKKILYLILLGHFSVFGQKQLFGRWVVSCPIEYTSKSSIKLCDICSAQSKTTSGVTINNVEIEFISKMLKYKSDSDSITTNYSWDDELNVIEFKLKEKMYKFKVLYTSDNKEFVLKDNDGFVILLKKKNLK